MVDQSTILLAFGADFIEPLLAQAPKVNILLSGGGIRVPVNVRYPEAHGTVALLTRHDIHSAPPVRDGVDDLLSSEDRVHNLPLNRRI